MWKQTAVSVARKTPFVRQYILKIEALQSQLADVVKQRDDAERARERAEEARWEAIKQRDNAEEARREAAKYQVLEGTPYSRYALPLEYFPSRDFRPRWGYSHPPEPVLDAWFRAHTTNYLAFFSEMRKCAPKLADIPLEFDEANLPSPAWLGVPYAPFDSVVLYTMVQLHRPKLYLEIGSGISTCFAYRAIKDAGLCTEIMSIDPEPRAKIDTICDNVHRVGLETCDISLFDGLQPGDILFFDGSHRAFMNSDVTVFMIDVLPRLKPGVIVHLHDITLPFDYPEDFKHWYWNEQYMLAVYLMANKDRIDPLFPTAFVSRDDLFASENSRPMIDLGQQNVAWSGGGAMWFTHTR
jgi:hypothetical protein